MTSQERAPDGGDTQQLGTAWWMVAVLFGLYVLSWVDRLIVSMLVTPIKAHLLLSERDAAGLDPYDRIARPGNRHWSARHPQTLRLDDTRQYDLKGQRHDFSLVCEYSLTCMGKTDSRSHG